MYWYDSIFYLNIIYISRINPNDNADIENGDDKRQKRRGEKQVKFYSSFEPIKGHIFSSCKV